MATIKRIEGLTITFGNNPGWLPPSASKPLPQTARLTLEIAKEEAGYFLLSTSDHEHFRGGDTWHGTLDDALAQAEFTFNVKPSDWKNVARE